MLWISFTILEHHDYIEKPPLIAELSVPHTQLLIHKVASYSGGYNYWLWHLSQASF